MHFLILPNFHAKRRACGDKPMKLRSLSSERSEVTLGRKKGGMGITNKTNPKTRKTGRGKDSQKEKESRSAQTGNRSA
jgi:hypothetical protein